MLKFEIIGDSLHQWELNRQISITGETIDEVHFAKVGDSNALVVIPVDGVASIPNIHLQTSTNLIVYAMHEDRTISSAVLGVQRRPKPDDYVYTETETFTFRVLEERITALGDSKLDKQQGVENAGKLFFVGADGNIIPLTLGKGLQIVDGVLSVTNAVVAEAICGQALCGEIICGGN